MHLTLPMVQFAVQMGTSVGKLAKARRIQVDPVNRCQLLGHAQTHVVDAFGRRIGPVGGGHLVDVARHPLHHEERPAQDVAGLLEPQGARRPHRCLLQRQQDVELPLQVVGLEQGRRARPQAQHHISTVCTCHDGQHHHLGRVPELDAVESLDRDVIRLKSCAQPVGEFVGHLGHV